MQQSQHQTCIVDIGYVFVILFLLNVSAFLFGRSPTQMLQCVVEMLLNLLRLCGRLQLRNGFAYFADELVQ